jgi:outer membrane protein assembly factor BamB
VLDHGLTKDLPANHRAADAIDVMSGERLWSVKCGNGYGSTTPMYANENVVAVGCDYDGIRGLDLSTGKTLWQHTGGDTQTFIYDPSAPGVLSAYEYAGSADVTLDLRTGKLLDKDGQVPVLGDPVTGLQAMGRLSVYDPKAAAVVLTIERDDIDRLGDFTPISTFDGRLTFMASDGLNVVSLTTGKADPTSPAKSSQAQSYTNVVADAGTGWALLGSVDAGWDPGSWTNAKPIAVNSVAWAAEPDGTISWDDLGYPSATTP